MVIDFHAHIYPEKIAAKAAASISGFYAIPVSKAGTVECLLECGRRDGIGRFVVFSAAAVPGQVQSINNYIAETAAVHGEFTGFGTLHRDMQNPGAEIRRITDLGLKGIKLHPDMQRFNIDDEKMMDIYALLEGRLPVIFHTGDYRYPYSHPARLARVLDQFPRLVAVAAHFGGWSLFDLALEYLRDRFCYFDVSSSIPFLGASRAEELIHIYGAERFLFGSDYPMWDPGSCLREFMGLNLSDGEQELILWKNAMRLLDGG
ncbi:MAG: amidohydrolase family protein [Treponema sp.]|jgi:predicted TIM-barrel fold metal-dependent hydrolase|nr:amidohydrolase family protein [Treponema sp.]